MEKTITELKDLRAQLEIEVNERQEELALTEYAVNVEEVKNVSAILKQIDKSYTWDIKNAAFLINLYDTLTTQKKIMLNDKEGATTIALNSLQLNTLYTVLTNITGTGIEAAKLFTRLLTNVGAQISDALNEMADNNKTIQGMHVELAELDRSIEEASKPEVKADEIEYTK
ncbi:hypothetical protein N8Z10_00020 [bacterium]|nr:hypothetical protein [bacterium]